MTTRKDVLFNELHSELLEKGKKLEKGTTHKLEPPFIETIIKTLEYFGADSGQLGQVAFDLLRAKYKIFDWLGMCYTGRLERDDEFFSSYYETKVFKTIEKMVKLYLLQNHVGGFAWWLRGHDLDVEEPTRCEDCIESYDSWHNQSPEERLKEQEEREKFYGGNIN